MGHKTFSNHYETELIKIDGLFIGKLPKLIPPSNTDITWNGIHWAMLTLPLPTGKYDRTDLTIHELFHRAQQSLGFMIRRGDKAIISEDEGTVYPKIVLTDNWGVLTVEEGGALLRSDWRWVIVSEPLEITDDKIIGEGWVIELNENYKIEENAEGNYILVKIGK